LSAAIERRIRTSSKPKHVWRGASNKHGGLCYRHVIGYAEGSFRFLFDKPRQGIVATTLESLRAAAVGFVEWLDLVTMDGLKLHSS
jgi:hypothetical protein